MDNLPQTPVLDEVSYVITDDLLSIPSDLMMVTPMVSSVNSAYITTCTEATTSGVNTLEQIVDSAYVTTCTEATTSGVTLGQTKTWVPPRPISPVSDDESEITGGELGRSTKKPRLQCYPKPMKLRVVHTGPELRVDGRHVRGMLDDINRTIALNHQEVMKALQAIMPQVRETMDEVSVLQQEYIRDVVSRVDESVSLVNEKGRQHRKEINSKRGYFEGRDGAKLHNCKHHGKGKVICGSVMFFTVINIY